MKKTMEQRIASAEQALKELREKHAKAEAKRKRSEAKKTKEDDERRRILAGSTVLEKVRTGEIPEAQFRQWLDTSLTEPKDRALFDL